MPTCHNHTASLSLRDEIVGVGQTVPLLDGAIKTYIYFDNAASTPAFRHVHEKVTEFLTWYSSVHRGAGFKSLISTHVFEEARHTVASFVGADPVGACVIFVKNATEAINKLANRFDWRPGDVVISTSMEHHSNDLPWRETIAVTAHVGYDRLGRIDARDLDRVLSLPENRDRPLKIGSFSAASNVTGILTDTSELARVMHAHGGYACFDYAAAGPYVDIDMHPDQDPACRKDALFLSMHKFTGGPQAPGLLAANRALFRTRSPSEPGGGTVLYTSPWEYRYLDNLQHREEGGTPPIVQVIRAGLVFDLKEAMGVDRILAVEHHFLERAIAAWRHDPHIRILGDLDTPRIGILSLILDDGRLHHNLAVRLLNDLYGIQTRGGCMCAGTYGHDLLGIDQATSAAIRQKLDLGQATAKPGWVRISFSPTTTQADFNVLLKAVPHIARSWRRYMDRYIQDPVTADWVWKDGESPIPPLRLDIPEAP